MIKMTASKSKFIKSFIGFAVSAVLIFLVFRDTDWTALGRELGNMNFWILPWVIFIMLVHCLLRAIRWRYLLPEGNNATLRQLFDSFMIGSFATFVLPLRAGEFIRPYLLTRYTGMSFSITFVSIIVERFFDLAAVLLSFGVVAGMVPELPDWATKGAWMLSFIAFGIFGLMLAGTFIPDTLMNIARFFLKVLPEKIAAKIEKFVSDFLHGAAVLRHGERLLKVVGLTALVWGSCYFLTHEYFRLFHMAPGVLPSITLAVVLALAVAAPSAPGFLGVYQTACVVCFAIFSYPESVAKAYSIVTHLYQYVIFIVYGIYVITRDNLKMSELKKGDEV